MIELKEYQKEIVDRIITEYKNRCILALPMGAGKTIISLEVLRRLRPKLTIVVCPAHLKYMWLNSAKLMINDANLILIENTISYDLLPFISRDYPNIIIVSYNIFSNIWQELAIQNANFIFDESHYLKDIKAQRTKKTLALVKAIKPKIRLLLTGTPALNTAVDLWTQINIINPHLFPSFYRFAKQFCVIRQTKWGYDFSISKNIEKLHRILIKNKILLRKTVDEIGELKELRRIVIPIVTPTDELDTIVNKIVKSGIRISDDIHISTYRKNIAKLKFKPSVEFIKEKLQFLNRIIVFAYHREITTKLQEVLSKYADTRLIIGGISAKKKHEVEKWFNENKDDKRVVVANIEAGGTGMNFPNADCVIFVELDWTPAKLEQAEARVRRLTTQKNPVIYYLISDDILEKSIINKLNIKHKTIQMLIDGRDKKDTTKFIE